MSSLYQPRPVLSSQRYSPSLDYIDTRRNTIHGGKLPLRESAGNAQSHSFNGLVSCYQSPVALSPPQMPASLPAPMVPSQSFECLYRVQTPRQQPRFPRRSRQGVNPLYFWPAFRQYRNRQAHKDTQKDKGGVWRRPELEDAFVDCESTYPSAFRFWTTLTMT
jgi:transcriptional enhancer factor